MSHHIQNWEENQGGGSQQGQTSEGRNIWGPPSWGDPGISALGQGAQSKFEVYGEARLPDQGMRHPWGTPETREEGWKERPEAGQDIAAVPGTGGMSLDSTLCCGPDPWAWDCRGAFKIVTTTFTAEQDSVPRLLPGPHTPSGLCQSLVRAPGRPQDDGGVPGVLQSLEDCVNKWQELGA